MNPDPTLLRSSAVASDLLDRAKSEWSRFAQAVGRLQVYVCCANVTAFISYSHLDRGYGAQAKSVLAEFDIESFLAHEDLEVSEEWQARILSELRRCDLFVPLLSLNFLASKWAPQEAGFIISRPDVLITPLSIDGTTPFGFLSHLQSRRIPNEGLTRELLIEPLATRMPRTALPALIRVAGAAKSFRDAESRMAPLVRFFPNFTPQEAQTFAEASIANGQIWSAALCRTEYLPKFIHAQGTNLDPKTSRALRYQVEHDERYREEGEQKA
ncbi:MAG: hypothetical protein QOF72_700 [Blastocatellia bacterium]|nr:hypothetical protein [Blastocatellia bacterium]